MILYFAGALNLSLERVLVEGGMQHRLLSYLDRDEDCFPFWLGPDAPAPFFLDCGAFSVMSRGAYVDIHHYCDWIKEHEKSFACYAALDVIGDWKTSARNYEFMRRQGLSPVPTFHMGSPMDELRRLLSMTDYIALGALAGATKDQRTEWLDPCFSIIGEYWPKKVHLFGVFTQWALERYPAYSVDASSAVVSGGLGRILTYKDGRLRSRSALDYAKESYDGQVLDFVSHTRADRGSAHTSRRVLSIQGSLALQRHITDVWAMRGVTWPDESEE